MSSLDACRRPRRTAARRAWARVEVAEQRRGHVDLADRAAPASWPIGGGGSDGAAPRLGRSGALGVDLVAAPTSRRRARSQLELADLEVERGRSCESSSSAWRSRSMSFAVRLTCLPPKMLITWLQRIGAPAADRRAASFADHTVSGRALQQQHIALLVERPFDVLRLAVVPLDPPPDLAQRQQLRRRSGTAPCAGRASFSTSSIPPPSAGTCRACLSEMSRTEISPVILPSTQRSGVTSPETTALPSPQAPSMVITDLSPVVGRAGEHHPGAQRVDHRLHHHRHRHAVLGDGRACRR